MPTKLGGDVADYQYITFIDPDDWLVSNNSMELLAEDISDTCADLVYFRNEFRNDEKLISTAKDLPQLLLGREDIIKDLIPALIFHKPFYGIEISASLWRGAFNAHLVWKNNIRFNENYWKGEDWLFYSDFLRYCRTAKLSNKILYAYYRRADSTINAFRLLSLKGISKSLFLLEHIRENALMSDVDSNFIQYYYQTRYTQSFLSYIYNIWDPRNPESTKSRLRITKQLIKESAMRKAIRVHSRPDSHLKSKLEYHIVRYPNALVLAAYGKLYHLAVKIKH